MDDKQDMTAEFMEREETLEKPEGMDEMAEQADRMESKMFQAVAPEGLFTERALNTFAKGINEALKLFPGAEPISEFEGNVDGPLPEPVTRALGMIKSAYQDYSGEEPFKFSDIKDDRGLKEVAGKLMAFSKDSGFRAFLAKPMDQEEDVRVEAIRVTREPEAKPEAQEDTDELFMSRLA